MNEENEILNNIESRLTCSCACECGCDNDNKTREEMLHDIKCYNFAIIELRFISRHSSR